MKINFGKITNKDCLQDVQDGLYRAFKFEDGVYDFQLRVEEDQVVVADALGRYVPLTYQDAMQLKQALINITIPLGIIREAEYQLDSLLSDVTIAVPA